MTVRRVSCLCVLTLVLAPASRGAGAGPERPGWSLRSELTLKQLTADGRWGPIAVLASASVATDANHPADLTPDDAALASGYVDNRLGLTRAYAPSPGDPPAARARHWLARVPRGFSPRLDRAVALLASRLPVVDLTPRGEAAFARLPVASYRVGATAFDHLSLLKSPEGRKRLQALVDDLFRRSESDPRAAGLVAAAVGSDSPLRGSRAEVTAALEAFDRAAARPLKDATTEEQRNSNWAYRLAKIQAARVRVLSHQILPYDPGRGAGTGFRRRLDVRDVISDALTVQPIGLLVTGLEAGDQHVAKVDDQQREALRERHKINDYRFATGLVTGVLAQVEDPTVRKAAQVLDTTANVAFNIMWATTLTSSFAMPLAIVSGVTQLLGLLGGGPSEMQLLMEAVADLHRDVRAFRRETEINFAYLKADLHTKTDAILDHVGRFREVVEGGFAELNGRADDIEKRVVELRGIVEANHQQMLKRFEELYSVSFLRQLNRVRNRKDVLTGLGPASSEGLLRELDDFRSECAFFVEVARTAALSGGDWQVASAYSPNNHPALLKDNARHFVAFADSPRGAYAYINDYARIAGLGGGAGSAFVNPDGWRLGVSSYFTVAAWSPEALKRDAAKRPVAEQLARMYLEGERVRGFLSDLVRSPEGSAPNRAALGKTLEMMAEAVDGFEAVLLGPDFAGKRSEALDNFNVWGADPLRPLSGKVKMLVPQTSQDLLKLANGLFAVPPLQAPPFALDRKEQLALEATLPDAYRLAEQLKQGHVEFRYEDVRWGEVREVVRYQKIWENFEIPIREWFGKVRLTVAADFLHRDREDGRYPVYRRTFLSPVEVKIGGLKNEEYKWDTARHQELNWEGEGRRVEKRSEHHGFWFFGHDVDHAIFIDEPSNLRAEQLTANWGPLKRQVLDPAGVQDLSPEFSQWLWASLTQEIVRQVTNIQFKGVNAAEGGLGALGDELRCVYGSQLMVYRFLELAMPVKLAGCPELLEKVIGREAVLNWADLAAAMRPGVSAGADGKYRLEIKGLIQGGPDGKPRVPLAGVMRARLDRLRTAVDAALVEAAAAPEPPEYPDLDDLLMQFPARAARLGIDLKAEVEKVARADKVSPRPSWFIYRSDTARAELFRLFPELKAAPTPPVTLETN